MASKAVEQFSRAYIWGQDSWLNGWDGQQLREFRSVVNLLFGTNALTMFDHGRDTAQQAEEGPDAIRHSAAA